MNHVAMTEFDTHHMSPNAQRWNYEEEKVKCSFYCGRNATTEHNKDVCCEQCRLECISSEAEEVEHKVSQI